MSEDLRHDDVEPLLGAYALDAVDPQEAALVERHLAGCPRCRAEVDASRELAAWLATRAVAEDAEALPPELWDRIVGQLANVPRQVPSSMPGLDSSRAEPARGGLAGAGGEVVGISAGRRGRRRAGARSPARPIRWVAAAAAAAAVAAIAVLGVDLSQTSGQLGRVQQALAGHGSQAAVAAALADPHHRLVRLDSSGGAQLAEFVVLPGGQGYMVSTSMPSLPADETYQLWAVISGQPISMGLLGAQPRDAAFTMAPGAAPTELAITVEPAGGVTTPDRSPVATGRVAQA